MFENVDGRTDRRTDGQRTDDGVTGILLAKNTELPNTAAVLK